jgi:hypothetical protein
MKKEQSVARPFGSSQSWPRRHEADGGQEAYRRARPGGGVTKQLPSVPPKSASSYPSAWKAEGYEERAECRAAFVAVSLGPAGMKPTEAKKPTVGLVPAEAFLIRLPSGLSRRRRN